MQAMSKFTFGMKQLLPVRIGITKELDLMEMVKHQGPTNHAKFLSTDQEYHDPMTFSLWIVFIELGSCIFHWNFQLGKLCTSHSANYSLGLVFAVILCTDTTVLYVREVSPFNPHGMQWPIILSRR